MEKLETVFGISQDQDGNLLITDMWKPRSDTSNIDLNIWGPEAELKDILKPQFAKCGKEHMFVVAQTGVGTEDGKVITKFTSIDSEDYIPVVFRAYIMDGSLELPLSHANQARLIIDGELIEITADVISEKHPHVFVQLISPIFNTIDGSEYTKIVSDMIPEVFNHPNVKALAGMHIENMYGYIIGEMCIMNPKEYLENNAKKDISYDIPHDRVINNSLYLNQMDKIGRAHV